MCVCVCVCSLDTPCNSESDSFDLDTLLGVNKRPSSSSTATPSIVGKEAPVDMIAPPTSGNTESKLAPSHNSQDHQPSTEIHESEDDRVDSCSDTSHESASCNKFHTRRRRSTFTLSEEDVGNNTGLIDSPYVAQSTPVNTTTQIKHRVTADQPSIPKNSKLALITPTDLPSSAASSRTYSKGSSHGLAVASSGEGTVTSPPTKLTLPSSLRKPAKCRGTFNSSVSQMHAPLPSFLLRACPSQGV